MSFKTDIPNQEIIRLAEKEEPRFLHILLKDKDCLSDAVSFGIKPNEDSGKNYFLYTKNNFLYTLIYKNFVKYSSLLSRSAMDSLIDQQQGISEEGKATAKTYWDKVWARNDVSVNDYTMLRDHINDRFILGQFYPVWRSGEQIIKSCSNHGGMVKEYLTTLNKIENLDADPYSKTMNINDGVDKAIEYIEDRRNHPDKHEVIFTGMKGVDDKFNGFAKRSYIVVSGMVNGGKTTFLMNVGFNIAKSGYNVLYVSLEKEAELFFRRILSLHALTDYNRIKRGGTGNFGLNDYWYNRYVQAAADLKENIKPNFSCLQFVQGTKLSKILAEVDKIKSQKKVDVLIVDYLQVIGFESNHPSRPDLDLADVHRRLQAYGRVNDFLTFTALQLKASSSKEIRKKADKAVSEEDMDGISVNTEDYSGSQMVIADADVALGVVLNKDKPPTKMIVNISKARDDESRTNVILDFDGRVGRVSDPVLGEGQVQAVKDVLYNDEITEEQLSSEDELFKDTESKIKENKPKNKQEETSEENKEDKSDLKLDDDLDDDIDLALGLDEEKPSENVEQESDELDFVDEFSDLDILGK